MGKCEFGTRQRQKWFNARSKRAVGMSAHDEDAMKARGGTGACNKNALVERRGCGSRPSS
jgi:hypothetical protein